MYHGDVALGSTFDIKFTTRRFSSGAPFTLAGTPAVAAYPDNSVTEITAGITLSVDFDSRTGLNNVRVVATSGNGYAAGVNYALVITAGTVDSVSVVGEVVGTFSIEARSALRPTVAGRTLDVSSGGEAGVDWANIGSPTTTQGLSGTTVKTATDVETDTADIQSRLPAALVSGRMDSSVGAYQSGLTPLQPTVAGRTLDVTATGEAGIDLDNTSGALAKGTEITGFNDLSAAQVNAEVDTALADYDGPTYTELLNLIRLALRKDAALATDLAALLTTVNADLGSGGGAYANTTDAQEAIRDNQGTPQTGDSFARLGAPAGASVSADVAAVKADTAAILTDTAEIGAAGAGLTEAGGTGDHLTAVPWNPAWDAEVQSEVQDAIEANHLDHLLAATYDPAAKPGAADALLNELIENDGGVSRYTANALEQAPAGSGPTAADIADAVWEEAIADHSGTPGSTAEQLAAAGAAGDPWATALPGAYTAGQAGKIVGDNLNATVSSRATQTTADAIEVDTQDIQARLPAALVSGRMASDAVAISGSTVAADAVEANIGNLDATVSSRATPAQVATELATYDGPTHAELVSEINDVQADIAALSIPSAGSIADAVWDEASADHVGVGSVGERVERLDLIASGGTGGLTNARAVNLDNLDAAVTTRATPAQVATELATYDSPTKAEMDAAFAALNDLSSAEAQTAAGAALTAAGYTSARAAKLDALPVRLRKNVGFTSFHVVMVSDTDGRTPLAGLTVTAQRALDGGAFAPCANAVVEVGSGLYRIDLDAADLNGDVVTLRFTATGADARLITAVLQEAA